jgi:hypothetical protein
VALDLAILGENDAPEVAVAVGIDAHFALMKAARFAALTLLGRMSEYYEDATFEAGEVPVLVGELEQLESLPLGDECRAVLSELKALAERARASNRALVVLAD